VLQKGGDFLSYTVDELLVWNEKIEKIANAIGLNYYPQEFEIISYTDMLAYEVYVGMPSKYPHWSYGKAYERLKTLYKYNLTGLPYEMVINSDPCLAYLMKDNTLLLQILTMAHVYGHNDFFKNNRMFTQGTNAEYSLEMFKNNTRSIRNYINDPSIGYGEVEKMLDAAHAIKFQTWKVVGEKRISHEEIIQSRIDAYKQNRDEYDILKPHQEPEPPKTDKIPIEPEDDLIYFICKYGELQHWQSNTLEIVRKETQYFIPQIETKIMNEGWASYWHYNILKELELPQNLNFEFLKRHNDVIAPAMGRLNPYYLGFRMFEYLEKTYGREKIFEVRLLERDSSFIRRYLTQELCEDLNLFQYGKHGRDYLVDEVPDDMGWKEIRNTLSNSCGMGGIPHIRVLDMSNHDKTLTLEHVYDGRELDIGYAESTLKYIVDLWKHKVILKTNRLNKEVNIVCDKNKEIITR
jgi:stage V sporulation protein R